MPPASLTLSRRLFGLGAASLLAMPRAWAATPPEMQERPPPQLDTLKWNPPLHTAIQALVNTHGRYSKTYDPQSRPYVVSDWNNTAIVGDAQQMLFLFMLEHFSFVLPVLDFRQLFHGLAPTGPLPAPFVNLHHQPVLFDALVDDIAEDYATLLGRYGQKPPPLPAEDLDKDPALQGFRARMAFCHQALTATRGPEVAQRWMISLLAGQHDTEVSTLSRATNEWGLGAAIATRNWRCPTDRPGKAGPVAASVTQMLRLTAEMANLFQILLEHGIDPVICSSAMEDVIALFASSAEYGYTVRHDDVFGARLAEKKHIMQPVEAPHTPLPFGENKVALIRKHFQDKRKRPPLMLFVGEDSSADLLTTYTATPLCCLINHKQTAAMQPFMREASRAIAPGKTRRLYLQGRDENTGEWRPHSSSILLGDSTPSLPV